MNSPHLQRALRIKTNSYRGGTIENISFRDVTVGQVAEAVIEVDFFYEEGKGGPFRPIVRNINVANVTCEKSKHAIFMRGYPTVPITGVTISDCSFNHAAENTVFQDVKSVSLNNVTVNGKKLTR
jgi:polygalacturonase